MQEFFSVKDDAPRAKDPTGSGLVGRSVGNVDLSKSALGHPVIYYRSKEGKEFFLTADVYAPPDPSGAPRGALSVHIYCPHCSNHLTIRQDNKAIDYDRHAPVVIPGFLSGEIAAGLGVADLGGRLSVEKFRCTWEERPDLRRSFGFGVCGFRVVIENNVARPI
jgi:hypothetical protein